ncbi:MAG: D-alanyl-lipoteichoic acid biosynthesis protein DltB [Selenomonas sp.]|nr:D-alanyl-lipoteichoic acid biosynthesis protein DltB [Selenomonas sp.]
MNIAEYGDFLSLIIFAILLLPAIILGCMGLRIKWYGIVISIPILYGIIGDRLKNFMVVSTIMLFILFLYYYAYKKWKKNWIYYLTMVLLILPVVEVKMAGLVHINSWAFLGISYMGFRIWQLVIEIHDGHINEFSLVDILYFVTFFPSFSSGPIDRYRHFKDECNVAIAAEDYMDNYLQPGIKKILLGMVYKFAFADVINQLWLSTISNDVTLIRAIEYMYAYTMYLFFDFAGYSLMAVGTGYILGVKLPDNFNKPFLARNMKEFWDRWHISLSRWFGDYLFSRVVLNLMRNKIIKKQNYAVRISYIITMFTMGLWHGFTVYYLLYGLYQGLMLVFSDMYVKSKAYRRHIKKTGYDWICRAVCFQVIAFGMLLFSGYLFK